MNSYIYITDLGDVRISKAEYDALKDAEEIQAHAFLRETSLLAKRANAKAASIIAACNRFAKHKYGSAA